MATILLADDSEGSRELLSAVFSSSGYSVVLAQDGREAVELAFESVPDMVILDLHMPRLDGYQALAELRADSRFAATPILALTASAMESDRERALAAGFSEFLTKPINLAFLRTRISRFLEPQGEAKPQDQP